MHREIEHITPEDLPKVPIVIEGISARFIRENRVIPIEQNDKVLKVVLPDPPDRSTIDAISVAVPQEVVVYVTESEAGSDYIAKFYSQEQKSIDQIIEEIDQPESEAYIEEEDVEHTRWSLFRKNSSRPSSRASSSPRRSTSRSGGSPRTAA
jgi:general secretion pathway protein E